MKRVEVGQHFITSEGTVVVAQRADSCGGCVFNYGRNGRFIACNANEHGLSNVNCLGAIFVEVTDE